MSAPQQPLYSTPAFELFRRGLVVQAVQTFHGINVYSNLAVLQPDWAQDCLNVVVSGSGGLSKMRLPVKLSQAIGNVVTGPSSFWDFQQANGTRQVLAQFGASLYYFTNNLSVATLIETNIQDEGQWSFSEANNILFGVNGLRAMKWMGTTPVPAGQTPAGWYLWGIVGPPNALPVTPTTGGTLSPSNGGYFYWYAWKNSTTGHCGNICPAQAAASGNMANVAFQPTATAPPDPQVDTIVWFRSLDGGGDPFRLVEVNLNTGALTTPNSETAVTVVPNTNNLQVSDNTVDAALDQLTLGPLINNPPILGNYTAVGQNRVLIFNLAGAPQDFIYSGYEQILFGRPEESFPPNNRIRLSIGAEEIAGGGYIHAGVVAFSNTGRMFMLRGQLEDISLSVPVNFSAQLEELPWTLGCFSHFSIAASPYGLIWLAGDKTVQLFSGHSAPVDISGPLYPYLSKITPGTEAQTVGCYFNWLERDWYLLLCAVNGSLSANRLFFFAFNKAVGTNSYGKLGLEVESVEAFVSDIPARLGGAGWVGIISNANLQRQLCIAAQGFIQQLPVSSDTVNGITQDATINPATNGNLNAYWRSGYFGNESPYRSKLYRWLRLITDQSAKAYSVAARFVDDAERTLAKPELFGPLDMKGSRQGLNRRAKRCAVEIQFPPTDAPSNVLELEVASIATSDR